MIGERDGPGIDCDLHLSSKGSPTSQPCINLPTSFLDEEAVRRSEGANDKFLVREPSSEEKAWRGPSNQPLTPERFEALRRRRHRLFARNLMKSPRSPTA